MTKRRPLIDGIQASEELLSEAEKDFVFGESKKAESEQINGDNAQPRKQAVMPKMAGRVPITTRARPEIGSALKRASLQRQLDAVEPNSMQDIVEAALEDWLRGAGYLD